MAEQTLKLTMSSDSEVLKISIYNSSYTNLLVNKRFSIGAVNSKHTEVAFVFKDSQGQLFEYNLKVKLRPVNETDLCILTPGMFIGKSYQLSRLADDYGLGQGNYQVKASYQNTHFGEKGAFTGSLASDWQSIVIK